MGKFLSGILSVVAVGAVASLTFGSGAVAERVRVAPDSAAQVQLSLAGAVRAAAPAVVNIYTQTNRRERSAGRERGYRERGDDRGRRGRPPGAQGSGVIVRADGIIVTNRHVIADADEITIVLNDRREFTARVLLADQRTDLAILRVDGNGARLPTVALENSDDVQVGDFVLAIGNPFGVGQTVTSGIVSAAARSQPGMSEHQVFIQTDAAINPGNSGGALVTISGRLLGINTAIFSRTGDNSGIGFAIPANTVRVVVDTALSGRRSVAQAWLGMNVEPVDIATARSAGLDRAVGVVVRDVQPSSPAAAAGLRAGDIVTRVDAFDVNDHQSLRSRVAAKGVGGAVDLTYVRNGRGYSAPLRLMSPPETGPRNTVRLGDESPLEGLTVADISPAIAEELLAPTTRGVVITEAPQGSTASRFYQGDVITEVNGRPVTNVGTLQQALREADGEWRITLSRDGHVVKRRIRGLIGDTLDLAADEAPGAGVAARR